MNPGEANSLKANRQATWVISDGAAGNERQALALAHALELDARVLRIGLRAPWRWLAPRLLAGAGAALRDLYGGTIGPPWPTLAIGCGRRAALLTRALRKWSGGGCLTVQILDPRITSRHFDVVIAPRHDHLAGSNVIETIGSLNPVDAPWLANARVGFAELEAMPQPRTTVLIGATHAAQDLDARYFDALLGKLGAWFARDGGSFLVSTSRRTPPALAQRLRADFARWPGMFWANDADGENPYPGLLAWADRIVVSPDSVNMLSEACATGKPVHTFAAQRLRGKLAELHAALVAGGHLLSINEQRTGEPPPPLRETAHVASLVRARLRS